MPLYAQPNIASTECLLSYGNEVTGGWFWTGILIFIFLVVFGIQKHRGYKSVHCFATTSWFTGILSMLLTIINCDGTPLVSPSTTLLFVIMAIFSVFAMAYQERNY